METAKRWQPKQKAGKPSLRSFILCYNQCFVLTRRIILPEQAERLHTLQSQPADRKPFTGNLLAFSAKCLTCVSNLFPITSIPGRSLGGRKQARRAACGVLPPGDLVNNTMEQTAGLSPPLPFLRVPHSAFHHLPLHFSPFPSLLPASSFPFSLHPFFLLLLCALSTFGPRTLCPGLQASQTHHTCAPLHSLVWQNSALSPWAGCAPPKCIL